MITNISECDFYRVWGAFRKKEKKDERAELNWMRFSDFICDGDGEEKRRKKKTNEICNDEKSLHQR